MQPLPEERKFMLSEVLCLRRRSLYNHRCFAWGEKEPSWSRIRPERCQFFNLQILLQYWTNCVSIFCKLCLDLWQKGAKFERIPGHCRPEQVWGSLQVPEMKNVSDQGELLRQQKKGLSVPFALLCRLLVQKGSVCKSFGFNCWSTDFWLQLLVNRWPLKRR